MVSVLVKALGFLLMLCSVMLAFTLIGALVLIAAFEPFLSSNFSSVVASNANGQVNFNVGLIAVLGVGVFLLYCGGLFLFMNGGPTNPHETASGENTP